MKRYRLLHILSGNFIEFTDADIKAFNVSHPSLLTGGSSILAALAFACYNFSCGSLPCCECPWRYKYREENLSHYLLEEIE